MPLYLIAASLGIEVQCPAIWLTLPNRVLVGMQGGSSSLPWLFPSKCCGEGDRLGVMREKQIFWSVTCLFQSAWHALKETWCPVLTSKAYQVLGRPIRNILHCFTRQLWCQFNLSELPLGFGNKQLIPLLARPRCYFCWFASFLVPSQNTAFTRWLVWLVQIGWVGLPPSCRSLPWAGQGFVFIM